MVEADRPAPWVIGSDGATAEIVGDDQGGLWLCLVAGPSDTRTRPSLDLLRRALTEAHARRAWWLGTTLEASAPSSGVLLAELRTRVGRDLSSLALHRAGSSVMVRVDLTPVAEELGPPRGPGADLLPTQRGEPDVREAAVARYGCGVASRARAGRRVRRPRTARG